MQKTTSQASASDLYHDAERYIFSLITGSPTPDRETPPEIIRTRAIERLDRMRAFLEFIGTPQKQFRSIHIGGTSGKGSTATLTAAILTEAGYRTGLHVSPYLQVATEKLVIDNRIASAHRYHELVQQLTERVDAWVASGQLPISYGEFWVALTFLYFAEEKVDVGVIEVGAGGRFDLTNVIQPEVVAITSIGLDHTVTLGNTLTEIAWHKAGIIKRGTTAITTVQETDPLAVIRSEAESVGATLIEVAPDRSYRLETTSGTGTRFLDITSGASFTVPLAGQFQAANAATAVAIVRAFSADQINNETIRAGLENARFPGRMEIVQQSPLVLLDGAHNPQKIAGLAADIDQITGGRRIIAVLGVLDSKNYTEMIAALAPHVQAVVATSPQVYAKPAIPADEIAKNAQAYVNEVHVSPRPLDAIELALKIASSDDAIVVTGSLYLIGNIRERWYPTEEILSQGTMWPTN
jgi:dihydrofolate synthase / folylpolyglutamate synthase